MHHVHGEQFKADWFERSIPNEEENIYMFLSSGSIKGVGEVTARKIVDKFGAATFDIIASSPDRLTEIKGITQVKAQDMSRAFLHRQGIIMLITELAEYKLPSYIASRLYKRYGVDSISELQRNPYLLVDEMFGVSFSKADEIAISRGINPESSDRVCAAVRYTLQFNSQYGHTFIPYDKLCAAVQGMIEVSVEIIEKAISDLVENGVVVRENIAKQDACYLKHLYDAEVYVAEKIKERVDEKNLDRDAVYETVLEIEKNIDIKYTDKQREAMVSAGVQKIMLLNGGPGTGKTTTVSGIISLFNRLGYKSVLTAPTGRAAKRMSELCAMEASTIHRLLGTKPYGDTFVFEHNEENPLNCDAIILDEISMVDINLMSALLKAMRPHCKLIMVGDADQLPSVGPGNVLNDIIKSKRVYCVTLDEIFRQALESNIIVAAHNINDGIMPDISQKKGDFFFLKRSSAEEINHTIVDLCSNRLPKNMGIKPENIQVLSLTRKNYAGTGALNIGLQKALNPPSEQKSEKSLLNFVIRENDRVMQIKNNYDIIWKTNDDSTYGAGMFNGDMGYVSNVQDGIDVVKITFDDRYVEYPAELLEQIELAYAMTVHKSQGSEFSVVVLALPRAATNLLSRQILYTAVTRAKDMLIIVGDDEVLKFMVDNNTQHKRYSGLRARIEADSD